MSEDKGWRITDDLLVGWALVNDDAVVAEQMTKENADLILAALTKVEQLQAEQKLLLQKQDALYAANEQLQAERDELASVLKATLDAWHGAKTANATLREALAWWVCPKCHRAIGPQDPKCVVCDILPPWVASDNKAEVGS